MSVCLERVACLAATGGCTDFLHSACSNVSSRASGQCNRLQLLKRLYVLCTLAVLQDGCLTLLMALLQSPAAVRQSQVSSKSLQHTCAHTHAYTLKARPFRGHACAHTIRWRTHIIRRDNPAPDAGKAVHMFLHACHPCLPGRERRGVQQENGCSA